MPNKIKNCFDDNLTFEKMIEAHERAKQGKLNRYEVLNFDLNLESNIVNLVEQIRNGRYKIGAYTRLYTNKTPQYKCTQNNDKFTLSVSSGGTDGYGNNALTYPVGLITVDEVAYAGGLYGIANSTYHLYTNSSYWTISANTFSSGYASVYIVHPNGVIGYSSVINNASDAFPSISLGPNALVSSGNGTSETPYIINTN